MPYSLTIVFLAVLVRPVLGQVDPYGEQLRLLTIEHLPEHARETDNWPLFMKILEDFQAISGELNEQADAHPDDLFLAFVWDRWDLSDWDGENQFGGLSEENVKILEDAAPKEIFEAMQSPLAPREEFRKLADDALARMEEEGVFDALDRLADHPYGVREPYEGSPDSWFLPELGDSRFLTRALGYRGRTAIAAGNARTAADCFRQMLALSRTLSYQPFHVDHMVAVSNESTALWLAELATIERLGVHSMLETQKEMTRWPSLSLHIEGERVLMHAGVSTMVESLKAEGETFDQPDPDIEELAAELVENATGRPARAMATPEQFHAGVDRLIDEYLEAIELPRDEQEERIDEIMEAFENDRRLFILSPMCGPLNRAISSTRSQSMYRNGVMVLLAIEAYRGEHGRLPDSLDDLTPEFLETLPHDPFAPDGRFRYLKHPDDEQGYVLYSVGYDANDNQGHRPEGYEPRRWDALHRSDSESDFVFGIVD